jgi:hypothetical protein
MTGADFYPDKPEEIFAAATPKRRRGHPSKASKESQDDGAPQENSATQEGGATQSYGLRVRKPSAKAAAVEAKKAAAKAATELKQAKAAANTAKKCV